MSLTLFFIFFANIFCQVSYSFDVFPRILVIHVKRFQYVDGKYRKSHTPVIMEPSKRKREREERERAAYHVL